ncbi:MAG: heme peroxidase family protein [Stellaceae bacterium]
MDPFKQLTHGGVLDVAEILFHTRFDYMFPLLAENPDWLLPPGANTQGALLALGTAMATDDATQMNDSTIPAIFTYFGQFIDHNITAQTDREIGLSRIATPDGNVMDLTPLPSQEVAQKLINGRRPQLDLEQVYGDGPALGTGANLGETEADVLYDMQKHLKVVAVPPGFDVPRQPDGTAIIADMRNNENLNVSQLHCAFLLFHNNIVTKLVGSPSNDERYIRARRLARWAYQYVVINDYLRTVCDPVVVDDILVNGNRYYAPNTDAAFLPLEFSVAAFRFGHSMIRPQYNINASHTGTTTALKLSQILAVGSLLDNVTGKLQSQYIIDWHNFVQFGGQSAPQMARRIDPLIAMDLGNLPFKLPGSTTLPAGPLLQQLARRNLLRGFLLSIPTGQAVAEAMDVKPLSAKDLTNGVTDAIATALVAGEFQSMTPLWYYVLQEARFQQNGNRLGSVGSRIVAETLIGLVRKDRTSYLNNLSEPAVTANGISVAPGQVIATIAELLTFAGVPI